MASARLGGAGEVGDADGGFAGDVGAHEREQLGAVDGAHGLPAARVDPGPKQQAVELDALVPQGVALVHADDGRDQPPHIVLAREADFEGTLILSERIRNAVESSLIGHGDQIIRLTVSIGFAVAESGVSAEYDEMYTLAASALREAKRVRNRCVVQRVHPKVVAAEPACQPLEQSSGQDTRCPSTVSS